VAHSHLDRDRMPRGERVLQARGCGDLAGTHEQRREALDLVVRGVGALGRGRLVHPVVVALRVVRVRVAALGHRDLEGGGGERATVDATVDL